MRKLLYLAAGAALLSAPAAFAQNDSTASQPPSPAMSSGATTDAAGDAVQAPAQDPPSDAQATSATDAPAAAAQAPAQDPPSDAQPPANPPPDQAAAPDQGAAPQAAPPDQSAADQAAAAQGAPPPPGDQSAYGAASDNAQANQGSRLYVQQGEYQGQGVQVISNAPVPDTPAVRSIWPPLSRAGRRTAPAGN